MDKLGLSLSEDNNFNNLQNLVTELLKDKPDEAKIKKLMASVRLKYSDDPIQRMNLVLQALHK